MTEGLLPPRPSVAYAPAMSRIIEDPAKFARAILRHDTWRIQEEILRSIAVNPRTVVKACHASSKTFAAAEAALWWTARYADGKAITTATSYTQVVRQLWVEIKRAAGSSLMKWGEFNQAEMRFNADNYAIGISTNTGVRFQGYHGRILIVIDEASGIEPEIWEAIESARAGGKVHILALGNPIEAGGVFYDVFHSRRMGWKNFTISAFDTPNFEGVDLDRLLAMPEAELDANPRPYLITKRWVKEKHADWGVDDPRWLPRVMGQFPRASLRQIISLEDVEACIDLELKPEGRGDRVAHFGGDIARFGDDKTVIIGTLDRRLCFLEDHPKQSLMVTAGRIAALIKEKKEEGLFGSIALDDGGLGGGVVDRLQEQNLEVLPLNFGWQAFRQDEFADLGTEIWWHMRTLFAARRVSIPRHEELIYQLISRTYSFRSNGKLKAEPKDEMKKRGLRSPDLADALGLALYPRQWISRVDMLG